MSKYFEVEKSQFVSLHVFVDFTLCDIAFLIFSFDPIQRAVAAAWNACCGIVECQEFHEMQIFMNIIIDI